MRPRMTMTAALLRGSPRQRARIQGRSERAFLLRLLRPLRTPFLSRWYIIAGIPKNNFHMRASGRANERAKTHLSQR